MFTYKEISSYTSIMSPFLCGDHPPPVNLNGQRAVSSMLQRLIVKSFHKELIDWEDQGLTSHTRDHTCQHTHPVLLQHANPSTPWVAYTTDYLNYLIPCVSAQRWRGAIVLDEPKQHMAACSVHPTQRAISVRIMRGYRNKCSIVV